MSSPINTEKSTPEDPQIARIRTALSSMMQRDEVVVPPSISEDGVLLSGGYVSRPHVILEEINSKKFVQFSGSTQEALHLDLPSQPLDGEERRKATAFFEKLGIKPYPVFGEDFAYDVELGRDVDRGAQLAMRIFLEVYRFPADFDFKVHDEKRAQG